MKSKFYNNAAKTLWEKHNINIIDDIFLGRNDRVLAYCQTSKTDEIILCLISGSFELFGFEDTETILLKTIIDHIDYDNKYAEVAGKKDYVKSIESEVYRLDKEIDITFPITVASKRKWFSFNINPIVGHLGFFYFIITDITELMDKEELLFEKTHKDSLTNLYNKYTFDYHYGLRYQLEQLHVFYLDLDDFKKINDELGHIIGNQYLKAFAEILRQYHTKFNLFYRLGGDEFVGLLFDTEENIKKIAQEILQKTGEIQFENAKMKLTVSIGIVKSTIHQDLVRKADLVLYNIKKSGKNNFIYLSEEDI